MELLGPSFLDLPPLGNNHHQLCWIATQLVTRSVFVSQCLYVCQITTLQAVHRAGIIHRDVTPANLVRGRRGEESKEDVFLIDFGIAVRATEPWYQQAMRLVAKSIQFASLASLQKKRTATFLAFIIHRCCCCFCFADPCPNDDLESALLTLGWICTHRLPWSHLDQAAEVLRVRTAMGRSAATIFATCEESIARVLTTCLADVAQMPETPSCDDYSLLLSRFVL